MDSDVTALVGHLLVPALAVDVDGRIITVNDALADCLGQLAAQLRGSELAGWITEAAALPEFLRAATAPAEFRFRTGDGVVRDLVLTLILRAPAGGAVLAAGDITQRRAAERVPGP